ncbi:hypothetical protein D3C76_1661070 [compost metagenome]
MQGQFLIHLLVQQVNHFLDDLVAGCFSLLLHIGHDMFNRPLHERPGLRFGGEQIHILDIFTLLTEHLLYCPSPLLNHPGK